MKHVVLIVVLVIPVLIYLFLEGFGVNQYSIPKYHQEPPTEESQCVGLQYPHLVDFEKYPTQDKKQLGSITVVQPVLDSCLACPPHVNQLRRVLQRHSDIDILNVYSKDFTTDQSGKNNQTNNWLFMQVDFPDLIKIIQCELLVEMPSSTSIDQMRASMQLVLLDKSGTIRGYYSRDDRDEIDRLITEVSILKDEQQD